MQAIQGIWRDDPGDSAIQRAGYSIYVAPGPQLPAGAILLLRSIARLYDDRYAVLVRGLHARRGAEVEELYLSVIGEIYVLRAYVPMEEASRVNLRIELIDGKRQVLEAIKIVKERGNDYMDLYGRKLVDAAIVVLIGHLLLQQAMANDRKKLIARQYIETGLRALHRDVELICNGDLSPLQDYELIAGPAD